MCLRMEMKAFQENGTCSYNEFVSSIYTISISVVTGKNKKSRQNVPCTGVSAVAYGRDGDAGVFYPHDLMYVRCPFISFYRRLNFCLLLDNSKERTLRDLRLCLLFHDDVMGKSHDD